MTPEQRVARGDRVARLLASEDVKAALIEAANELRDDMVATPVEDRDARDALHAEYHGLMRVVRKLRAWADDGAMLAKEAGRQAHTRGSP